MELRSALLSPFFSIGGQERFFTKGLESQPYLHIGSAFRRPLRSTCYWLSSGSVQAEELEDSTLVDVQEGSNGYFLFKFGTTQVYDDPPRFISSGTQGKPSTFTESEDGVINCSAAVYRVPDQSTSLNSFKWRDGYEAVTATGTCGKESSLEGPPVTPFNTRTPLGLPGDFMRPFVLESFADRLSSYEDAFIPNSLDLSTSSSVEMVKVLPANIALAGVSSYAPAEAIHSMAMPTIRRADRPTKKAKARHRRASKLGARDLFKSNSFQICELLFSYPFMDSTKASISCKEIPKEKYTELLHVLNHVAVGLAGGGLALVLFVASRMLCLNATLDGAKLTALLRGVGLIWLSSAFQKFSSVVKRMAECDMKARQERKEHLAMFRKQVHAVTFQDGNSLTQGCRSVKWTEELWRD